MPDLLWVVNSTFLMSRSSGLYYTWHPLKEALSDGSQHDALGLLSNHILPAQALCIQTSDSSFGSLSARTFVTLWMAPSSSHHCKWSFLLQMGRVWLKRNTKQPHRQVLTIFISGKHLIKNVKALRKYKRIHKCQITWKISYWQNINVNT